MMCKQTQIPAVEIYHYGYNRGTAIGLFAGSMITLLLVALGFCIWGLT